MSTTPLVVPAHHLGIKKFVMLHFGATEAQAEIVMENAFGSQGNYDYDYLGEQGIDITTLQYGLQEAKLTIPPPKRLAFLKGLRLVTYETPTVQGYLPLEAQGMNYRLVPVGQEFRLPNGNAVVVQYIPIRGILGDWINKRRVPAEIKEVRHNGMLYGIDIEAELGKEGLTLDPRWEMAITLCEQHDRPALWEVAGSLLHGNFATRVHMDPRLVIQALAAPDRFYFTPREINMIVDQARDWYKQLGDMVVSGGSTAAPPQQSGGISPDLPSTDMPEVLVEWLFNILYAYKSDDLRMHLRSYEYTRAIAGNLPGEAATAAHVIHAAAQGLVQHGVTWHFLNYSLLPKYPGRQAEIQAVMAKVPKKF